MRNTNDDLEPEAFRKRWVIHAYVDEEDVVIGSRFVKSTRNGRLNDFTAAQMKYLSVGNPIFRFNDFRPFKLTPSFRALSTFNPGTYS